MKEKEKTPEQQDDEYSQLQVEDSSSYLEQLDSEVSHLVRHHDYILLTSHHAHIYFIIYLHVHTCTCMVHVVMKTQATSRIC